MAVVCNFNRFTVNIRFREQRVEPAAGLPAEYHNPFDGRES